MPQTVHSDGQGGEYGVVSLTATMLDAIRFAQTNNAGRLHRHPGGRWTTRDFYTHFRHYGTSTVEGIVSRGVGTYTEWRDGKNGRFPIEMTVNFTPQLLEKLWAKK